MAGGARSLQTAQLLTLQLQQGLPGKTWPSLAYSVSLFVSAVVTGPGRSCPPQKSHQEVSNCRCARPLGN